MDCSLYCSDTGYDYYGASHIATTITSTITMSDTSTPVVHHSSMSSSVKPLPAYSLQGSLSPDHLALRAQAVLPPFPQLTETQQETETHTHNSSNNNNTPHVDTGNSTILSNMSTPHVTSPVHAVPPPLPNPLPAADHDIIPPSCTSPSSQHSKAMIAFLLESLQTTMFTKKKDALDTYQNYFINQHPRYSRSDALLILFGSPITPTSTLAAFTSTSSFAKMDKGLLAASGQLSWKNHHLRASAAKALGLLALLLDTRCNPDAHVFHQLFREGDYCLVKMMKLPKHLASSGSGNITAALRVIEIIKDIRPDFIEQLLNEKEVNKGQGNANTNNLSINTLHVNQTPVHDPQSASPKSAHSPNSSGHVYSAHHTPEPKSPPLVKPAFHTAPGPLNTVIHTSAAAETTPQSALSPRLSRPLPPANTMKPGSSPHSHPGTLATHSGEDWKQKLRSHLSGFFATRVSREELEHQGVLKPSRVFGVSFPTLAEHGEMDTSMQAPKLLVQCMQHLRQREHVLLPGLFRISGDSCELHEMKTKYENAEPCVLSAYSPHSVSGLLKLFLREMPEPLLGYDNYEQMVEIFRAQRPNWEKELDSVVNGLPHYNHSTLTALLDFLRYVSSFNATNLMSDSNLSICFSPNIFRPRVETLETVAKDTPVVIAIIKWLISRGDGSASAATVADGKSLVDVEEKKNDDFRGRLADLFQAHSNSVVSGSPPHTSPILIANKARSPSARAPPPIPTHPSVYSPTRTSSLPPPVPSNLQGPPRPPPIPGISSFLKAVEEHKEDSKHAV